MVMRTISATRFSGLDPKVIDDACQLSDKERSTLLYLAPYAAEYAPAILEYAKPVMAGLFVGIWGMSVTVRLKNLSKLHKETVAVEAPVEEATP